MIKVILVWPSKDEQTAHVKPGSAKEAYTLLCYTNSSNDSSRRGRRRSALTGTARQVNGDPRNQLIVKTYPNRILTFDFAESSYFLWNVSGNSKPDTPAFYR